MQFSGKNTCPVCLKEVLTAATCRGDCGLDLPSNKQYPYEIAPKTELYEIVPEGVMFGIALRGEVKIHDLEMEIAQSILTALNRGCEFEKLEK